MLKYNKLKIFVMLYFNILFLVAAILLPIKVGEIIPVAFAFPSIVLSVLIYKNFAVNNVISKYEKAMQKRDYELADVILTKHMKKYKWLAVLRVNLYLIKGEPELYIYNYNNFSIKIKTNKLRYYNFLLEVYKVYYDLLVGKSIDLSKTQNVDGIKSTYYHKICCEAITLLKTDRPQDAINLVKQIFFTDSGGFTQYVYAYVQYLSAKKLGLDLTEYNRVLDFFAYNDFLKQIIR